MDQKTIRLLAAGGVTVALGVGLFIATRPSSKKHHHHAKAAVAAKDKVSSLKHEETRRILRSAFGEIKGVSMPLRPIDHKIFDIIAQRTVPKDPKDAFPQSAHRVTVLMDRSGRARGVRIDLNRDGIEDERWMLGSQHTIRDVALFGSHRSERYFRDGDRWTLQQGMGVTMLMGYGSDVRPPPETEPLRPMDRQILEVAKHKNAKSYEPDALPNAPFKVSLYSRHGKVDRARIDVNRNKETDEVWNLAAAGGHIVRTVREAQGKPEKKFMLTDGKWVRTR